MKVIQYNHRVEERPNENTERSETMSSGNLILTEIQTNTMYMSESAARDIRKRKPTRAGELFVCLSTLYPTAKVVCLTDEEFNKRFGELEAKAEKHYGARFVLSNTNPERTIIHHQKNI